MDIKAMRPPTSGGPKGASIGRVVIAGSGGDATGTGLIGRGGGRRKRNNEKSSGAPRARIADGTRQGGGAMNNLKRGDWEFMVPYGKWTCADGREVLFNRGYRPILERYPGRGAKAARSGEWVEFVDQVWFFDDYTSPLHGPQHGPSKEGSARVDAVLAEWGLPPLPPRPRGPARSSGWFHRSSEFAASCRPIHNPWSDIA